VVQCPYCGYKARVTSFKLLRKPWRFRFYTVKRLQYPKCGGIFNYYKGVSLTGKKSEFTIRVKPKK